VARRYYVNFAPTQNISPGINSTATSLTCPSFAGWPTSFPFTATIDYGTSSAEIVLVTNISGTVATIQRGYDGSVAVTHVAGATFDLTPTAKDLDEANSHINGTAGVHGVSSNVVGVSDVQTLSNKTFSGNTSVGTINASGSVTAAGAVQGGSLTAGSGAVSGGTGTFSGAVQAASATITGNQTVQGNQTVNGALTVAGNQTNSGSLSASTVGGILQPKQYANEAGANAAGANVAGNIVYLTTPTTLPQAGHAVYSGGAWHLLAYLADSGWTSPALGGSWATFGAPYATPGYRLYNGRTELRGLIAGGNTGVAVFTLPVGMRPAFNKVLSVFSGTGTARLDIGSNGTVIVTTYQAGGSNTAVSLENISFIAEQ